MKKQRIIKAIYCLFLLFIALSGNAQKVTTIRASVDKNNILIGEQINFVVEANIPENDPIRFFGIDSIPHFEFINKGKIDTSNTNQGTVLKQLFRLTSFDSGQWVIPSYYLSQGGSLKTDSIIINVGFLPMDTAKDYNDIKEIIEVAGEKKMDWTWYYVGGGILLLLLIIYLLTRKKKKQVQAIQAAEKIIDPYKEALEQLDKLQQENLVVKDETKQYYSRLTDIFRIYVEKRMNILSLQQTTDDLVVQLRDSNLDKENYNQLSQALRLSDFVKFAKYIPTENDNKNVFDVIKNSIQTIEKTNPPSITPVTGVKEK